MPRSLATEKDIAILAHIQLSHAYRGYAPSLGELAEDLQRHHSSIATRLHVLGKRGVVRFTEQRGRVASRSYSLTKIGLLLLRNRLVVVPDRYLTAPHLKHALAC